MVVLSMEWMFKQWWSTIPLISIKQYLYTNIISYKESNWKKWTLLTSKSFNTLPVHCIWTRSVGLMFRVLGWKSYSTAGYVCTMFPRFPLTFKLNILSDVEMEAVLGRIRNTWLLSWKILPVWSVFMFIRNAVLPPTSMYGSCSIMDWTNGFL